MLTQYLKKELYKQAFGPSPAAAAPKTVSGLQKVLGWLGLLGVTGWGIGKLGQKYGKKYRGPVNTSAYDLYETDNGYTNQRKYTGDDAVMQYLKRNIAHDPNEKSNAQWAYQYVTPLERASMDAHGLPRHTWDKKSWEREKKLMGGLRNNARRYDVREYRKKFGGPL